MAELVRLASSIATLAAAGFHIARKISTVADDLGTASGQIKSIAVDTKAVAIILRDIEAKLLIGKDSSRELNEDTRDVLAEVLDLCRYEIEDLDQNLAPLKDDGKKGDAGNLKQKAKWLFDKPKIAARQASLNSLKLTLSLLLHNVHLFDGEHSQHPFIAHRQLLPEEPKTSNTVVFVQPVNGAEPPPAYQVADVYKDKATVSTSVTTLAETEKRVAILPLSDADDSNSGHGTVLTIQALIHPPPKLVEVQEKVRCLASNKKGRRDARRAEKAMKIEAWKERKQAKRTARAAWRGERHAVRA